MQVPEWIERVRRSGISETQRFLLLAILIGLFAGLSFVCFHISMDYLSWFILGSPVGENRLATVLGPALGGGLASLLVLWFFRTAQGSGVNHTKAALYISDGHVPAGTVFGKFIACSLSIGSGNSLGPEDPALHMGAGIGSWLGRTFGLARENMRRIAAVGAAAGIAAAFNTPITAVLFVIEEVIGAWNTAVMGSTVLSAVSAVVVSRYFLGNEPLFRVPDFQLTHPSELLIYAGLGLVGGVLAAFFVRGITRLRALFGQQESRIRYARSFAAGLFVGAIGLWVPQIMGAGYEAVDSALHDQFPWGFLLVLGLAKLVATAVCFGAGTPGGMFAPTLFSGAMIGGAIGGLARLYWPFPTSPGDAYVLVGMGTFFAGVFRAPMTSVFMVFEVSATYVIIVPVMIANTIAYLISRQLQPVPFFSVIAQMEGLDLPSTEQLREEQVLRVEDAMQHRTVPVFSQHTPVVLALAEMTQKGIPYSFVHKDGGSWSLLEDADLQAASQSGQDNTALGNALALEPTPALHPDLPLDNAMRAIGSHPILPVCSRVGRQEILGTLTLQDIHRAYGINHQGPLPVEQPR